MNESATPRKDEDEKPDFLHDQVERLRREELETIAEAIERLPDEEQAKLAPFDPPPDEPIDRTVG